MTARRRSAQSVRLGFAVDSGRPVDLPIAHMCVTGQSQQAGKTTALEALITRSELRAVTFITKRGETSFAGGRRIPPFFRERADWQFVASLIDATMGEKNKLLRSFLMKVCRTTKTLAEVQRNVEAAKASSRGFSESIYTEIEGYLELVVPQLAQLPPARAVEIGEGLNVMDLSPYRAELQGLVIRSVLEHVYEHEQDVVTVIPEAWEFLPEQRGSPVRLAFETLVRKGAGLRNFVWIDSQDLAGVWKLAIRACPVILVGVQREANEIKRTLANIPGGVAKPTAADVATLALGQFFACWGKQVVKTYVQPAWMNAAQAEQVATGALSIEVATATSPLKFLRTAAAQAVSKEDQVTKAEADALQRELAALKDENDQLRRRLAALEKGHHDAAGTKAERPRATRVESDHAQRDAPRERAAAPTPGAPSNGQLDDTLYQAIKARLFADAPAILKLAVQQPELEVTVERRTFAADGGSTLGRVARLLKDGQLEEPRRFAEILKELERTGTRVNNKSLSVALQELVVGGFLTKEGVQRYRAVPGMRVRVIES